MRTSGLHSTSEVSLDGVNEAIQDIDMAFGWHPYGCHAHPPAKLKLAAKKSRD